MSQQKVLVKKLQAVEALGQAKVIALDKTGTITKNQMTVEKIFLSGQFLDVTGSGYEPKGSIFKDGAKISPKNFPDLDMALRIASLTAISEISKWLCIF